MAQSIIDLAWLTFAVLVAVAAIVAFDLAIS